MLIQEVLFATANQPNERYEVFTEDCLRNMAAEDSRCRYDEEKRQLWIAIDDNPDSIIVEISSIPVIMELDETN